MGAYHDFPCQIRPVENRFCPHYCSCHFRCSGGELVRPSARTFMPFQKFYSQWSSEVCFTCGDCFCPLLHCIFYENIYSNTRELLAPLTPVAQSCISGTKSSSHAFQGKFAGNTVSVEIPALAVTCNGFALSS